MKNLFGFLMAALYVALFFGIIATAPAQSFEFSQIRHIDLTEGTTRAHGAGVAMLSPDSLRVTWNDETTCVSRVTTLMDGARSVLRGDAGELIQIVRDTVGIIERIIINEGRCTTILENEAPPIVIQDDVVILRGSLGLLGMVLIGAALFAGVVRWAGPWLAEIQDRELETRDDQAPVGFWDDDL